MKCKKYIGIFFVLLIGFSMIGIGASATSPRYMKLQYQPDNLKVTILHFSPITRVHYVYKVDVEKNGGLVTSEIYSSQPRFFFFTYSYNVSATSGDQLTVTAYCSLFGKLTRSITIA